MPEQEVKLAHQGKECKGLQETLAVQSGVLMAIFSMTWRPATGLDLNVTGKKRLM